MDFSVIQNYIPLFRKALILTLEIGWMGVLLSMVIGVLVGMVVHFRIPVLTQISKVYIEIFRNTPLLIQLFFLYFALPKIGITMSPEMCGVLGLGLLGGSYNAEILRSGIESVDKIQTESALSLGMTKSQVMLHIVLPQAVSSSVPAFVGNIIFLLKETSVFSAVSLMDLMFTAKDIIGLYYKTTEALTLLVIFYLLMLLPVSVLGSILERRLRYGSFGN